MNKYRVQKVLGEGSFGKVVLAENTLNGEKVAIKEIKKPFYTWKECLNLRELKSLQQLKHENIVALKEVIRENSHLHFVFEYLPTNLCNIITEKQNVFNEDQIQNFMSQLLQGLGHMHKHGYFHRDIKPENLLSDGSLLKIADFGLARETRSRPPYTEYVSTRWYRAPEVILRSTNYSSPIDIWACGCIMAELYLKKPLFPGKNLLDQINKISFLLNSPTSDTWKDGIILGAKLNIHFPQMKQNSCSLNKILTNACEEAISLIKWLLQYDPGKRPTCYQALNHPFFHKTFPSSNVKEITTKSSSSLFCSSTFSNKQNIDQKNKNNEVYTNSHKEKEKLKNNDNKAIGNSLIEIEKTTKKLDIEKITKKLEKVTINKFKEDIKDKEIQDNTSIFDCSWDDDETEIVSKFKEVIDIEEDSWDLPFVNIVNNRIKEETKEGKEETKEVKEEESKEVKEETKGKEEGYDDAKAIELHHMNKKTSLSTPINQQELYLKVLKEKTLLLNSTTKHWTEEENKKLCKTLREFRGLNKNEKWKKVKETIGNGVTRKECYEQYKKLVEKNKLLKHQKTKEK